MLQKMSRLAHDISYSYFSTMACSRGMKEAARWQFCKNTQRPFRIWAFEISSSALGPWSRPREIISRCKALPLSSSANLTNCARGSVPIMKQCWIYMYYCCSSTLYKEIKSQVDSGNKGYYFLFLKNWLTNSSHDTCIPGERMNMRGVLAVESS